MDIDVVNNEIIVQITHNNEKKYLKLTLVNLLEVLEYTIVNREWSSTDIFRYEYIPDNLINAFRYKYIPDNLITAFIEITENEVIYQGCEMPHLKISLTNFMDEMKRLCAAQMLTLLKRE